MITPHIVLAMIYQSSRGSPATALLFTQEPQQEKPHVQALLQLQAWWMSYQPASKTDTSGKAKGGILAPLKQFQQLDVASEVCNCMHSSCALMRDLRMGKHIAGGQDWVRTRSGVVGWAAEAPEAPFGASLPIIGFCRWHAPVRRQALSKACTLLQRPTCRSSRPMSFIQAEKLRWHTQ